MKRSTFTFSDAASERLDQLAKKKNTTKTELLRRAIALYEYLDEKGGSGNTIKLEQDSGEKIEIVLP